MKLMFNDDLGAEWNALIETLAAMITLSSEYVVLQVYTPHDNACGPYVQTLQEEDGALHLEAASNQFLDPKIGPDAINTLREMGWDEPTNDEGIPNFKIFLRSEEASPGEVARFLVATLRDAYLVTTHDSFEFAPPELFVQIVSGEFGAPIPMQFSTFDIEQWKKENSRSPE
jgi:hypothetical protein